MMRTVGSPFSRYLITKYQPNLFQNFSVEQRMLLGRHDEVVSLVLVVHDVLERDAELVVQIVEEILYKVFNSMTISWCLETDRGAYSIKKLYRYVNYIFEITAEFCL